MTTSVTCEARRVDSTHVELIVRGQTNLSYLYLEGAIGWEGIYHGVPPAKPLVANGYANALGQNAVYQIPSEPDICITFRASVRAVNKDGAGQWVSTQVQGMLGPGETYKMISDTTPD